ncbi:MAG: DUF4031 domain-containing protein [Methyloceanibacter sp.]|nr:DUF4031 domain-containing protein [Methyloceanibacter sp.]
MPILTDGLHLVSNSSLDELHEFAASIGLKRCWYRRGHYDLFGNKLSVAVAHGAKTVHPRECAKARRVAMAAKDTNKWLLLAGSE